MYSSCVFLLLIVPTLCVRKPSPLPPGRNHAGKVRRETPGDGRYKLALQTLPFKKFRSRESLSASNLDGHQLSFVRQIGKSLPADRPEDKYRDLVSKLVKKYLSRLGHNSSSSDFPRNTNGFARFSTGLATNARSQDRNNCNGYDLKNSLGEEILNFKERLKSNTSDCFGEPGEYLTLKARINDLITQSLFAKPAFSKSNNSCSYSPLNSFNPPPNISNDGNPKKSSYKNMSVVLSPRKPDLSARSFFNIVGNHSSSINPFQISNNAKSNRKFERKNFEVFSRMEEPLFDRASERKYYKSKLPELKVKEENSIKSARRLFDVIQSQNPLDLLNIPVLMNRFTVDSGNFNRMSNSKSVKVPFESPVVVPNNDQLSICPLSATTTEKCSFFKDLGKCVENKKIDFQDVQLGNYSIEENYLPWGPLPSILSQSIGDIPLVLVPINRIQLKPFILGQDTGFMNINGTSDISKPLNPLGKMNNFQDLFSKHFNNLDMKDLLDLKPTKLDFGREKAINVLSHPDLNKIGGTNLPLSVEKLFNLPNMSAFNNSIQSKQDFAEINYNQIKNGTNKIIPEPKRSKVNDQVQSILPILKVTANMALSKYSNNPILQKKITDVKDATLNNITNYESVPTSSADRPYQQNQLNSTVVTENSDLNINYFTVSPEVESRINHVDGDGSTLERSTEEATRLTAEPQMLEAEGDAESDSGFPNTQESLKTCLKNAAENMFRQSLKKYEENMKSELKTALETPANNSLLVVKGANPPSLDTQEIAHEVATESTEGYEEIIVLTTSLINLLPSNNVSDGVEQNASFAGLKNPREFWEHLQHMTQSSKIEDSTEVPSRNENIDLEENSTTKRLREMQSASSVLNTPSLSSLFSKPVTKNNDIRLNKNQIKEWLSAMLTEETRENSKIFQSLPLTNVSNDSGASLSKQPEISLEKGSSGGIPDKELTNSAKKKDNQNIPLSPSHIMPGHSNFYVSNRSRSFLETPLPKDGKIDASYAIPSYMVDIFNKIETLLSGSLGYKMLLVPSDNSLQQGKVIKFEMSPPIMNKSYVEAFSVTTTESGEPLKSDNIYQIVKCGNSNASVVTDLMTDSEEKLRLKLSTITPLSDNENEPQTTSNDDGLMLQKPIKNSQPIILIEVNSYTIPELNNILKLLKQNVSVSSVPTEPPFDLSPTLYSNVSDHSPTSQSANVAEPPLPNIATSLECQPSSGLEPVLAAKCTTVPPLDQWKCKEATVFPVYPMYPVYPLKPIIITNVSCCDIPNKKNI